MGFKHLPGGPGHQQTSGKVDAAVKEAKSFLRKAKETKVGLYLAELAQQNTPTESIGTSLAQQGLPTVVRPTMLDTLPPIKELLKPHAVCRNRSS